jgi:hypothetical protein
VKSTAMKKHLPLLISSAVLLVLLGGMVFVDARATHGHLYYPLDDTYIHMAISKNIALHGVWGATRYHFAAASSSILYTVLLGACFSVFGVHEIIPLVLATLSTLLALIAVHLWLLKLDVSARLILACEVLLVLVIPLPSTALLGMEHGFQLLFVMLLALYGAQTIAATGAPTTKQVAILALLAALAEGFRFESAFLALFLVVALTFRKRILAALAVGLGVLLPVAIFGFFSRQQGWPWLPAPILVKGNMPHPTSIKSLLAALGGTAIRTLAGEPLLLLLVIAAAFLYFTLLAKGQRWWDTVPVLLVGFVVTSFLHLQFASVGWLMRYEMYLVGFGIVAIAVAADSLLRQAAGSFFPLVRKLWAPAAVCALFVSIPMIHRSFDGFKRYTLSGRDRWQIHIRPAMFVKRYYNDSTVVVNDLGAMAFLTDAHLIDVYGLGDITPLNLRHSPEGFTKATVERWIATTGAEVAVIQTGWTEVRDRVPDSWVQVGKFQAERNVVWGDLDIGFFSIPPHRTDDLKKNLEEFDREVPMR